MENTELDELQCAPETEPTCPITEEPADNDAPQEQETVFEITPEPVSTPEAPVKKKKNWGIFVLIGLLVVALLAQPFVLKAISGDAVGISGSQINDKGELILYYTDGTSQNLGLVVGQSGTNGTTTIVSDGGDHSLAISQALRSSVSIYCTFSQESRHGAVTNFYSAGSGVIYQLDRATGSAFIITNYHVVYDEDSRQENGIAEQIDVYLYGSEFADLEMKATYVGGSMYYDLAVLRVDNSEILKNSAALAVQVADSDNVQVGSAAIAIGNAEGEGISATCGVVSVDSEYLTMTAVDGITSVDYRVMRIDTAVNSGNSGGGLFDRNGHLVGIVNAKIMDATVENIGYALPSAVVTAVVDNIIDNCYGQENESVLRPIMGITVITTHSKAVYDEETGLLRVVETVAVYTVDQTKLGRVFQVDDQLLRITVGGQTKQITRQYQLIDAMLTARVGDVVEFVVLRDGEEKTLSITITDDCLTAY